MDRNHNVLDNIIIVSCSCFTVGVFAPLEIFFMNSSKIWFDIYDLLFPLGVYCAGGIIFAVSILLLLSRIQNPIVAEVYSFVTGSLVLVLYVIGSFVPIHISMVDEGGTINWLDKKFNAIHICIITLCLVILILIYRLRKRQAIIAGIVQILFLIQCITLFTISMISPGKGWKHRDEMILTEKNFQTYSRNLNMEILVLDEFDARIMTELLCNNNDYVLKLDGFTFYPDTTSMYNFSDCSVAQIITGVPFIHQSGFDDYLNQAYGSSYLINRLKDEYSLNIYDDTTLLPSDAIDDLFDNYVGVEMKVSSKRTLMKYMYRLVGCKYLPFYFRQYCWFATEDLEQLKCVEAVDGKHDFGDMDITQSPCNPANTTFYYSIDNMILVDENMFHWHHLRGIHGPRTHDANMHESSDPGVMECARGLMHLIDKWIDSLKDKDVYDNHVIIILADHGTKLYPIESFRSANSLFMVKGYNEHHELVISDKKVSYDELDTIYEKLLNGASGDDAVEGLNSESIRRFYRGLDGYYEDGDLIEYIVHGKAEDVSNIQETGVIYR